MVDFIQLRRHPMVNERTCTYTPVLPTYSFSHSSNKMLTWINMNDKTIKNEKNKKPQKLPTNNKEGKSYILNRPQFNTTLNNLLKWKIMLEFICTNRICFGPIEHAELSVRMTDKNIWFSESLQSHPLYLFVYCHLNI